HRPGGVSRRVLAAMGELGWRESIPARNQLGERAGGCISCALLDLALPFGSGSFRKSALSGRVIPARSAPRIQPLRLFLAQYAFIGRGRRSACAGSSVAGI